MLNANSKTRFNWDFQVQPEREEPRPAGRYRHILVPNGLADHELPALRLGAEMAALQRAALTVLYVRHAVDDRSSVHWLDAIDQLHQALDQSGGSQKRGSHDADAQARQQIKEILDQELPAQGCDGLEVRVECRTGDVADQIAQFADETSVDLVIMSTGRSRWWFPVLPASVRRVLRHARHQVILVGPDVRDRRGSTHHSS